MVFFKLKSSRSFSLEAYALEQAVLATVANAVLSVLNLYVGFTINPEDDAAYLRVPLLFFGTVFIIPFCFAWVLLRGISQKKEKILLLWITYACVETIGITFSFIAFAIYGFIEKWAYAPIYFIMLAIIYPGRMYYVLCVINSLRLSYLHRKHQRTLSSVPLLKS